MIRSYDLLFFDALQLMDLFQSTSLVDFIIRITTYCLANNLINTEHNNYKRRSHIYVCKGNSYNTTSHNLITPLMARSIAEFLMLETHQSIHQLTDKAKSERLNIYKGNF